MTDRYDLQSRYLELTRDVLPARAHAERWCVTADHCIMRIVLDHVFEDCWYRHLDRRLRAYKQLNQAQLEKAVAIAVELETADPESVAVMNRRSLAWRGH